MADCIINSGIYELPCAQIGGINEVYIGTFDKDTKYTLDVDNVITAVLAGTPTLYAFVQDSETAGLVQTPQFNRENLAMSMQSVLNIKSYGLDKDKRNQFLILAKAPVFALIKSNAGLWYLAGLENAGRATEGLAQLGMALLDHNGFTLSFTWNSQNGVFLVSDAGVADFTLISNVVS